MDLSSILQEESESESSTCALDWDSEENERIIRTQKLPSKKEKNRLFKQILRMGISTLHRPEMYLSLSGIKTLASELKAFWPDTVKIRSEPKYPDVISLFGHPEYELLIPNTFLKDFLTIVKNQNVEIEFEPLIPSVAAILLHYLEPDLSYLTLQAMINSDDKYFVKNKKNYYVMFRTIKTIIQQNCKKLYEHAKSIKLDFDQVALYVMPLFFTKKMNSHIVFTIFDSFINEGRTVLMRYLVAIIIYLEKDLLQRDTPQDFLQTIFEYIISLHTPSEISNLGRLAFGLNFIKRNRIFPIEQNEREKCHFLSGSIGNRLPNIINFINHNTPQSSTQDPRRARHISVQQMLYSKTNSGQLITSAQFWDLKQKVHFTFRKYNAYPIYRLSRDGSALHTFFRKAKSVSPCMLIIKAKTNTIGALVVNPIEPKARYKFYGSPLTTVFELNTMSVFHYSRRNQYFVSATSDSVSIGNGETGSAIYFEEGFRTVVSDRCDTFNSPPLLSSQREEIIDVELYKLSP